MAEKDKRSRALLRNLRKQARKGTLSSRERKTLLDQESKFRKARRGTAKGVGLGLAAGAAGLLASPAAQLAVSKLGVQSTQSVKISSWLLRSTTSLTSGVTVKSIPALCSSPLYVPP